MTKKTRAKMRRALFTMSLVLVMMMVAVGGTIAWLSDKTDTVTNTFAPSNINITLDETEREYKMVPGDILQKDPKVTFMANSEDAWLFVEIEESALLDKYITYTVDSKWTAVPGVENVYYMQVTKSNSDQEFSVIAGNTVTVNTTVTTDDMEAVTADNVTLKFTAYAIQAEYNADVKTVWANAKDLAQVYPGTEAQ